ncbi:MAG: hypothetical protein A3J06_00090 [Candidatus Moranbacteria bacterium RIFCSPLOWO2_02_FULL_48_19]|nr:MAG: hypothetical protein A3J06_00090 [Candidatus Moranbacteria bacterium RIFCSPLOWO2_02_FULL_48_19]OGI30425.1 MAG: hypothetical protein A3G09_01270 [Candidatus Moranbacteria bacterium RIFCSPLOWO2_12_FULL_48_12]
MREQDFLKAIAEGGKAAGDEGHKGIGIDQQVLAGKPVPSATLQPASPDVPPAAEPASAAADVDIKGIRGIRRRNQRQKPTVSKTAAPAAAAAEPNVLASQADLAAPGNNVDSKTPAAEKVRAGKERTAKAFMDSIPRGATIELTSKNGSKAYYHRDPDSGSKYNDFLVGKAWKRAEGDTVTIDTEKVWKRLSDGWKGKIVEEEAPVKKPIKADAQSAPVAAEPAVKAESIPGSQAEPAIASGAEKSEEERKKDFVESVPNGEVICLINKTTGARAYYRSLNGNFLKGQSLGKHKIWATEEAWERYQDTANWTLEGGGQRRDADAPASSQKEEAAPKGVASSTASQELGAPRGSEAAPAVPSQKASENAVVSKFKNLEDALEEARQRYAKADFEQTSILRNISKILRFDRTKYEDKGAKEEYDNAFRVLRDARLADIHQRKDSGELSEEKYRLEMGRVLMSSECEGRIKIFQARQQVKMESLAQSKIGWLVEGLPRLAHWYNKLPKGYRYGIGIALGLGAVASFGTGAAAAGPILIGLRRVLTGATTFAALDTALESLSDRRHEGKVEKGGDAAYAEFAGLEKSERTPEQIAEAKRAFLEGRMGGIHEQFKRRKVGMMARKTTALAAGIFMGSGYIQEKIQGWFKKGGDWFKIQEKIQSWFKGGFDWAKGVPSIEAHSGDSTWKLLGQYLSAKDSHFSGMNEAQRTYAIDALKDKLAEMSPDQLKAAGFESGDISKLGIGEHINFDKLVGDNVAEAMKGASGLSAEAMESITKNNAAILEWAKAHPGVKLTDALIDNNILHGGATDTLAGKVSPAWANEPGDDFNNADGYTVREVPADEDIDDIVSDLSSADAQLESGGADVPKEADSVSNSSSDAQAESSGADDASEDETVVANRDEGPVKNADIEYERDIRLGKTYDINAYKEYFAKNPEAFGAYKELAESYFGFISQGDMGAMKVLGEKAFENARSSDLDRFVKLAREAYGSKLGLPSPKEKVYNYVARMAMLGMEHPTGKHIPIPRFI